MNHLKITVALKRFYGRCLFWINIQWLHLSIEQRLEPVGPLSGAPQLGHWSQTLLSHHPESMHNGPPNQAPKVNPHRTDWTDKSETDWDMPYGYSVQIKSCRYYAIKINSIYIYIYIHTYACKWGVYTCIYIYIYIHIYMATVCKIWIKKRSRHRQQTWESTTELLSNSFSVDVLFSFGQTCSPCNHNTFRCFCSLLTNLLLIEIVILTLHGQVYLDIFLLTVKTPGFFRDHQNFEKQKPSRLLVKAAPRGQSHHRAELQHGLPPWLLRPTRKLIVELLEVRKLDLKQKNHQLKRNRFPILLTALRWKAPLFAKKVAVYQGRNMETNFSCYHLKKNEPNFASSMIKDEVSGQLNIST